MDEPEDSTDPLCPIRGENCLQKDRIMALEKRLTAVAEHLKRAEGDRKRVLGSIAEELRTLNAWVPSVDKSLDRVMLRTGEVAQGLEDLRRSVETRQAQLSIEVQELQNTLLKNGQEKEGGS
jgi:hypothetical protein